MEVTVEDSGLYARGFEKSDTDAIMLRNVAHLIQEVVTPVSSHCQEIVNDAALAKNALPLRLIPGRRRRAKPIEAGKIRTPASCGCWT